MNIKKMIVGAAAGAFALGAMAVPAFAANPHFLSASASFGSGDSLVVSFREVGLGNNQTIDYLASADATAEYGCVNRAVKHPKAANKETVSGPVSTSGTFSSDRNGSIRGSLTLQAPGAGDFSCPNGLQMVLASVSYTNVSIEDTTNSVLESIDGTFSKTFFTF